MDPKENEDLDENEDKGDGDVDEHGDEERGISEQNLKKKVYWTLCLRLMMYLTMMDLKYRKSMLERRKTIF